MAASAVALSSPALAGEATAQFQLFLPEPSRNVIEIPKEGDEDENEDGQVTPYIFYSDRQTGGPYGLGFDLGLPVDATDDEPRACVYEPFFVAYQDYRSFAVNLSAALEVSNPVAGREQTEVAGDVTLAAFRRVDRFATILEANVEFDSEESPVRVAPALYWRPVDVPFDLAVSLPVGLNRVAPEHRNFWSWRSSSSRRPPSGYVDELRPCTVQYGSSHIRTMS